MTAFATSSLLFAGTAGAPGTQSFQSMVSTLTTMFQTCGWVNTNAVGSIVTSSATPPFGSGSGGGIVGYQVWRFNDVLHNSGSAPVFVKLEYGSLGTDAFGRHPGFSVIVGFRHDGSGTVGSVISGVDATPRLPAVAVGTPVSGTIYNHRLSIVSGGDAAMIFADNIGTAGMFYVERTKDSNGNPTNEGVVAGQWNGITQTYRQTPLMYSQSLGQTPLGETNPVWIGSSRASSAFNNDVAVSMFIPMLPYGAGYPSRMAGVIRNSELTQGITHTFPVYGTSSVFFVSSNTSYATMGNLNRSNAAGAARLLIRAD
jgi:hypothetical protein